MPLCEAKAGVTNLSTGKDMSGYALKFSLGHQREANDDGLLFLTCDLSAGKRKRNEESV